MDSYRDRTEAGTVLADAVSRRVAKGNNLIVLGLPRGGVPVAFQVAKKLGAELDLLVVRKLGFPGDPELAFGALTFNDTTFIDTEFVRRAGITEKQIAEVTSEETTELNRREELYRSNLGPLSVRNKRVVLVDDGIATGATLKAALKFLKAKQPAEIILAVPVAPEAVQSEFEALVDQFICPMFVQGFIGVGGYYKKFNQVSDEEVLDIMKLAKKEKP